MGARTGLGVAIGLGTAAWVAARLARQSRSHCSLGTSPEVALQSVRSTYDRYAPWYDAAVSVMALGQERVFRQEAVLLLRPPVGATVLEVACGTGANFPYLEQIIGPAGRVVGLDCAEGMLKQARNRVVRHGWRNVSLMQGDAADLELDEPVDAILCVLAIGLIPDRKEALRRMVTSLRPGGRILIADARLVDGARNSMVNVLMRVIGRPWLPSSTGEAYWAARPWEELRQLLGLIEYRELFGGAIYCAVGTKPA